MVAERTAAKRKEQGLCVLCGVMPASPGGAKCGACTDKYAGYMRERYEKSRHLGLCTYCKSEPARANGTQCERCRENRRKKRHEAKQDRLFGSLCIGCGKAPQRSGHRTCADCHANAKSLYQEKRSAWVAGGKCLSCGGARDSRFARCAACRRRDLERKREALIKGLCPSCLKRDVAEGRAACRFCLDKARRIATVRKERSCLAGICTHCPNPRIQGLRICVACRERLGEIKSRSRKKRREAGLCSGCKGKPLPEKTRCERCYVKDTAARILGSRKRWIDLKGLLDSQGGRCPYTSFALTLGVNTSIDHKIAASKGGSNDLDNLQWVYAPVNTMKWNLPEAEFLAIVKQMAASHDPEQIAG
jgi:hypothetical protein